MLIIESQYFSSISAFKSLCEHGYAKIDQYENFTKGSFRNRCMVLGGNGVISFTVPIAGGREQKLRMKDIRIDYSESWQRSHIRTLATSYNNSPFYHHYKSEIDTLIASGPKFLIDLNYTILDRIITLLRLDIHVGLTSEYKAGYENASDYRNMLTPKNYQTQAGVPRYAQVFADRFGFQPNLSILDLLFCEGPNSGELLNNR
jgi:hypothetical protein